MIVKNCLNAFKEVYKNAKKTKKYTMLQGYTLFDITKSAV